MRTQCLVFATLVSALTCLSVVSVFAQSEETGRLTSHVDPKQAYVFVDGKAIRYGSQTMKLAAGPHEVGVYNYGYIPQTKSVRVGAGETSDLHVDFAVGRSRGSRFFCGH